MYHKFNGEDILLGRVFGGFAWPSGERAGYCCVIGEAYIPEPTKRAAYHLYLIEEFTSIKSVNLIKAAITMQVNHGVDCWFGRGYNDEDNHRFLQYWNREVRPQGLEPLEVSAAYMSESNSILYHFGVLDTCLQNGTLHGTKGTDFHVQAEKITESKDLSAENYPAVAAVAYAVSQLRRTPPLHDIDPPEPECAGRLSMTGY